MDFFTSIQKWLGRAPHSENTPSAQSPGEGSFDQIRESEKAYETVKRGIKSVPLDKIKGSVGRYRDFDQQFRLNGSGNQDRLQSLTEIMSKGLAIPPISLYQIKDGYFIVDGHHRVTVARSLKQSHIQAHVLELLPSEETPANRLYLEKVDFRDKAGLTNIVDFTEPGQSTYLFDQVTQHQHFLAEESDKGVNLQEAGADWYRTIYLPLRTLIENSGLLGSFPDRTLDDLYLYISSHQWQKEAKRRYGIGIDKLIPRDMEAFRKKMARKKHEAYPEMKRDITVFILINVDGQHEQRLIDRLFAFPEVMEVHSVHGSIDLVVKATLSRDLLASDAEVISQFTHSKLRCMKGILSTQTLIPGVSLVKTPEQDQ